jgi:uncharacterized phage-associated protein
MLLRFDETKATQAAGFLLSLRGGRMHYIKLIKLLYLADRAALLDWGAPITGDRFVSMSHGPVVSNVLDLITKDISKPVWAKFISDPIGDDEIELLRATPTDRLSKAEENLLRDIFAQFGHRNRWDIIDNFMHKLPEWRDPKGRSIPIKIREILEAGGEGEEEILAVLNELRATSDAEEALSNAKC